MRVTTQISANTAINNILDNYARLLDVQNQMATGRRVLTPSDDPLATNDAIRLQSMLSDMEQYLSNLDVGESFLGLTDSVLQDVNDLQSTAKAHTVSMAQDTTTPTMRQGTVLEVQSILQEIVAVANRKVGRRCLFGGTRTIEDPFEVVGTKYVNFRGNEDDITLQVDRNSFVPMNVKASDVFGALVTRRRSRVLEPEVNLDVDTSSRLEDLNGGRGVAEGSIQIRHSVVTNPIGPVIDEVYTEVDLRSADTLEDVADLIMRATNLTAAPNPTRTGLMIRQDDPLLYGTEIEVYEVANNTTARDLGLLDRSRPVTLVETSDPLENLSAYSLTGVDRVDTGPNGELYFDVTDLGGGNYQIDVYSDATLTTLAATGSGTEGTITLNDGGSGTGIAGTVDLAFGGEGVSYVTAVFDGIVGDDLTAGLTPQTLLADIPDYHGTPITIANGSDDLVDPALAETRDTNNNLHGYQLAGLTESVNTDPDGNLYWTVTNVGGTYQVEAFRDSARGTTDRVAVGTRSTASGTVTLTPDNGSGLSGTVELNYIADDNDIETAISFPEAFRATVQVEAFEEENDTFDQVRGWQVHGLRRGVDTDGDGILYVDVVDAAGTRTVDVYADAAKADLVASGVLEAGEDNGRVELIGQGTHDQVGGSVNLEYLADDTDITLMATFATVQDFMNAVEGSHTYTRAAITEDGRSIELASRLAGATLHVFDDGPFLVESNEDDQLTRWNIQGIQAGVNAAPGGELYAEFLQTPGAPNVYTVNLYSDAGHTNLVATGSGNEPGVWPPVAPNELTITLSEAPGSQSGLSGSVNVQDYTADDTDIVLRPRGLGLSGKRREGNIFSTLSDVISAGQSNDAEALHDLLGDFETDLERVLAGRAEAGAKVDRFQMLRSRIKDEQTSFTNILSQRIDLDYADAVVRFQAETNVYNASLKVAAQILPMSLVDFI